MKGNKKAKSAIIIAATTAALVVALPLTLTVTGLALPCQFGQTFLGEMKYKMQRLKETEGKRIIVVGGSSVPFSLKSELLEREIKGYGVVDFGMYADMGTAVMLDWARADVREGDVIIISPEQNGQTLSCHFSGADFWQCADGYYSLFNYLSAQRKEIAVAAFPEFAGKKMYYSAHGAPAPNDVYSLSAFNEYGDICYAGRTYNIMDGGYIAGDEVRFDEEVISDEFIEEINGFVAFAESKKANVFYRFSPVNAAALAKDVTVQSIDGYYDFLNEKIDCPILGNPHDTIMDSGWFYDTNFHLNDSGATYFTKGLIEDLKVWLKDPSPTDISVPPMPQIPQTEIYNGDNSDLDCFTYEVADGKVKITGLSQAGVGRAELILPCGYNGLPITAVDENAFRGNTDIQSLTVQPNIRVLHNFMFDGCANFKRLILTGKPTDYSVGSGLREGAAFLIEVEAENVSAFKLNYSWQQYSYYIRAKN